MVVLQQSIQQLHRFVGDVLLIVGGDEAGPGFAGGTRGREDGVEVRVEVDLVLRDDGEVLVSKVIWRREDMGEEKGREGSLLCSGKRRSRPFRAL
jgi:hypothetical protein